MLAIKLGHNISPEVLTNYYLFTARCAEVRELHHSLLSSQVRSDPPQLRPNPPRAWKCFDFIAVEKVSVLQEVNGGNGAK